MENLVIHGGRELNGEIHVQGSKNGSLPILAATVLVDGISVIHNCPDLTDVNAAIRILEYLGCVVFRDGDTVIVDSRNIVSYAIPESLMREMRSSIVFLGSIIGRMGIAEISSPGGCEIGLRPIDLHLSSLKTLGAKVDETHGCIEVMAEKGLDGAVISLSFPSVGATENIILACALARGRTTILNAAREPEIADLAEFLNKCGCKVNVHSQGTITVDGVSYLHGCEHTVIPDRIAAITFMAAVGATGGDITISGTNTDHYNSIIPVFQKAGCLIEDAGNYLRIRSNGKPKSIRDVRTMPYPGFPTDAQAPFMAMECIGDSTSVIVENIFESRFKHVSELTRMGAKIKIEGKVAIIDGVETLYGVRTVATDLRGGSALIIAGLCASGKTIISSVNHIDRGYENIEKQLRKLGAEIERSDEE